MIESCIPGGSWWTMAGVEVLQKGPQQLHSYTEFFYSIFCEAVYSALCSWNFFKIKTGSNSCNFNISLSNTLHLLSLPDTQFLFQHVYVTTHCLKFLSLWSYHQYTTEKTEVSTGGPILSHVACCLGNQSINSVTHFSSALDNISARFGIIKESANSCFTKYQKISVGISILNSIFQGIINHP